MPRNTHTTALNYLIAAFLTIATTVSHAEVTSFGDHFDQQSCLRQSGLSSWLNTDGDLVLTMNNGFGQGLQTATQLGHGLYKARIRTDVGGGSVVAFYLMGVENEKRNNPSYYYRHDEIDFELVGSLHREGNYLGKYATWFNAFHQHTAVILPKNPKDDAGGSMLTIAERDQKSNARIFDRHVLPEIDRSENFYGHNYNDGQYYTYSIDWKPESIVYSVENDQGELIKSYRLTKSSDRWPQTKMYLALTIWAAGDYSTQWGFSGKFDPNFGRPMRAFVDYVTYEALPGTSIPASVTTQGQLPWEACGYHSPATPPAADCRAFNADGRSCADVGYVEGQIGTPWGADKGRFRCVQQCLQWYSN